MRRTQPRRQHTTKARRAFYLESLESRTLMSATLSAISPSHMPTHNVGAAAQSNTAATVRYRLDSFATTAGGTFGNTFVNSTYNNAQVFFDRYKDTFTPFVPDPTPDPTPGPTPDPTPPGPDPVPDPVPPPPPPPPSSDPVTVTQTPMGSLMRLTITGTSGNDSIAVSQSGDTITIVGNGTTTTTTGTFAEIAIYGADGNDTITVQSSVNISALLYGGAGTNTLRASGSGKSFIVTLGAGSDTLTGNGVDTSFWADSSDTVHASSAETLAGRVHRVSGFYQPFSSNPASPDYVPLTLNGQNLTDPTDTGSVTHMANSLWGTGPVVEDVNQGGVGDCYYLASIQSLADQQPGRLEEMAVDLGDGTYAVEFNRNGTPTYVRVDGDMPAGGWNGLAYAHPLNGGAMWAPIMEKAYAYFRSGANTFNSLNWGWTGSALYDLGVNNTTVSSSASNVFTTITNALNNGKPVAAVTFSSVSGAPIIGSHAYSVVDTSVVSGTQYVTVRNPWGTDGAGNDANPWDGYVTITLAQFINCFSSLSVVI